MTELSPAHILQILEQALPQAALYNGETMVIVLTGSVLSDPSLLQAAVQDIVYLRQIGVYPIVVHGDEVMIEKSFTTLGLFSTWQANNEQPPKALAQRQKKSDIAEMVLAGLINKQLASLCTQQGGIGLGISGRDAGLISAKKKRRVQRIADTNVEAIIDTVAEGEIVSINPEILMVLEETEVIPFVAPLGSGEKQEALYVNPHDCAAKLSSALVADKLIYYGEAPLLQDEQPVKRLSITEASQLCEQAREEHAPFLPILQIAIHAILTHTGAVYCIDGTKPHNLLLALFSQHGTDTCICYE